MKSCIFLPHDKISAASHTVATAWIAPKIWQGQPPTLGSQSSKFHPNRFTFGGVIAEHVKAILLAHSLRVYAMFARTSDESRERHWYHLLSLVKLCQTMKIVVTLTCVTLEVNGRLTLSNFLKFSSARLCQNSLADQLVSEIGTTLCHGYILSEEGISSLKLG